MKKTIFLVLAALLLVCASAGCIAEDESYQVSYLFDDYVHTYVDEESGVEYLVYYYAWGSGMSVAMTPRYNADGTLKINEEFRK